MSSQTQKANESSPLLSQQSGLEIPSHTDEFSHLSPYEAELLRAQVVVTPVKSSFFSMYRYAGKRDRYMLFAGVVASMVSGCLRPLMTVRTVHSHFDFLLSNFETRFLWEMSLSCSSPIGLNTLTMDISTIRIMPQAEIILIISAN